MTNGNLDENDRCFMCYNDPDGVFKGSPRRPKSQGRPICHECADTLRAAKKNKGHIHGLNDAIKTSHKIEAMLRGHNCLSGRDKDFFYRRAELLGTLLRNLSYDTEVDVTWPRLARIFFLEAWARSTTRAAKQELTDIDTILAEGKSLVTRSKLRRMESRREL